MADVIFNSAKVDLSNGDIKSTDDIWVMLVDSSYVPNPDTHKFRSDVTGEVTGSGYTAGGADFGVITVTEDDTNNRALWDAADPVWDPATITARGAVLYKKVGTAATDRLLMYLDFGADVSSTNAPFTVALNGSGFLALA